MPFIIAGPCSAESEEQLIETAKKISASGKVNMLRAGIWKPRTRPNAFEGVGSIGLPWLIEAGKQANLPVVTEIANAKHVELVLKAGIKHIWIGARTSVNPFAIQEIADSLKGSSIEVFVKNPINPDLNLWIGAIERLKNADIKDVHAIHRGFSSFKPNKYRNEPMWEIPIALKNEFPDIQLLCDPSHIGGKRDLIQSISQKALDLNYDGLMIETHRDPDKAWSDAEQQITPTELDVILANLVLRQEQNINKNLSSDLSTLRENIDKIDRDILTLLGNRMKIADEIGIYKKTNNITILQLNRWREIQQAQQSYGPEQGLSLKFIEKYLEALHQESIRHQTKIMND